MCRENMIDIEFLVVYNFYKMSPCSNLFYPLTLVRGKKKI